MIFSNMLRSTSILLVLIGHLISDSYCAHAFNHDKPGSGFERAASSSSSGHSHDPGHGHDHDHDHSHDTALKRSTRESLLPNPTDLVMNSLRTGLNRMVDNRYALFQYIRTWFHNLAKEFMKPFGLVQKVSKSNEIDRSDEFEEIIVLPLFGRNIQIDDLHSAENILLDVFEAFKGWQKKQSEKAAEKEL